MNHRSILKFTAGLLIAGLSITGGVARAATDASEITVWETFLKEAIFKDANIIEDKTVIDMNTPYRAEDAAVTPVTITAQFAQTPERYIEKLYLVVDKNPQPLVGEFNLTPDMGKADLALRVRIDQYTFIRAIAVLNNGEHHMVANFVKAQGGCSDPPQGDLDAAMQRIGKMKFRTVGELLADGTQVGQFSVSHPNLTGMQVNQRNGFTIPEHYVKTVKLTFDGKVIMEAKTGISVSADPSFRFFFKPGHGGKFKAEVEDSKGNKFAEEFDVSQSAAEQKT
jgi:sulfur-oxidizing protein SoxY